MQRIRARWVVLPDEVMADAVVTIDGDRIAGIDDRGRSDRDFDGWLVPGFIDTHVHGGAGVSLTDSAARDAIDMHRRHGTTSMFASTLTHTVEQLEEHIRRLSALVASGDLVGIHVEGPFLHSLRCGAQNRELLCDPTVERLEQIFEAGAGTIRMMTLAPELPGGLEAVGWLRDRGIAAAFGHSDADAIQTREAIDAGISVATHLFNGMRPIHHRKPGPAPSLLSDPRVLVELICDGFHVTPDVIQMAIDAAGLDRVAFVTDAMPAAGAADGEYPMGALRARVVDGQAHIIDADGEVGPIAGSTLTMDQVFHNAVHMVGLSMSEASRLTSTNAARWHGLKDVGAIAVGKYADMCVMDRDANLQAVVRRGRWLKK